MQEEIKIFSWLHFQQEKKGSREKQRQWADHSQIEVNGVYFESGVCLSIQLSNIHLKGSTGHLLYPTLRLKKKKEVIYLAMTLVKFLYGKIT